MNALSVRGLTKTYRNGVQALKGVDLEVERGDFFALLGPNGAGKTTFIGIITSLVNKSAGTASVFGHDIERELEAAKACIGIVPQEINFNMFESPRTIVVNQAGFYGIPRAVARQRAEKYLRQLQLWDKRGGISRGLSGGMKRRLMIARALMHEPRLLILDEPTAGVDIEIRRSMWDFLREINTRGTTIILTTHYLEEAEALCRNIAIINDGRIVERDRMSSLLRRLHVQTFVLNVREALTAPPALAGYATALVDEHTLEVEVSREENLNGIFARLSDLGIEVLSMRNKVNRLEEIFMQLVEGRAGDAGHDTATPAARSPAVRAGGAP
ncbi:MAG: ABC transporter ATP-binding protein [Gammaproteobacteria bacterium]|nr:ABC transporter ATP-binding protein [Gammaproteobacteria bacterium]